MIITLRISRYPAGALGERIRKWRLEQGLFQKDLAKMIEVDEMSIVNWEKNKKASKLNLMKLPIFAFAANVGMRAEGRRASPSYYLWVRELLNGSAQ